MEHGRDISLYTADELKMATVDPDVSADMIVFLYLWAVSVLHLHVFHQLITSAG